MILFDGQENLLDKNFKRKEIFGGEVSGLIVGVLIE